MLVPMSQLMSSSGEFVTREQLPPNLKRLKKGDVVRLRPGATARRVDRVGYRKTMLDYLEPAADLLRSVAGTAALRSLSNLVGQQVEAKRVRDVIARALAQKDELGGRERGIVTYPLHGGLEGVQLEVLATRNVTVGTYYPPSGLYDDYEDGGLDPRATIVLVKTRLGWLISGDLERVK